MNEFDGMTFVIASNWREVAEWDWVELGDGQVLHAVADTSNDTENDWEGIGHTECGRGGTMRIPGFGVRMSAPRCKQCCDRVGMPHGDQIPKNDERCRAIAEIRARRFTGPHRGDDLS